MDEDREQEVAAHKRQIDVSMNVSVGKTEERKLTLLMVRETEQRPLVCHNFLS